MPKKKQNKPDKQQNNPPVHNPADEGLVHDLIRGTEEDLDESYIDKQEARYTRGEDNEDMPEDADE